MSTSEPGPDNGGILLEEGQRFSSSVLWRLMKSYYADMGPRAWLTGEVPHYITCNTYIAQSYAEVVLAYLHELARTNKLVRDEPVYIIELASGVGAFASYFLHKFGELHQESSLRDVVVRYIMTDFTPNNLEAVSEHPHLRVFADKGLLGFGKFDIDTDEAIVLRGGHLLGANSCKNPVIVLGNYAYDTFRQDIFRVEKGKLHEVLVTTRVPGESFTLSDLRTRYTQREIDESRYYDDALCNEMIAHYRANLVDTTFTIPYYGLQATMRLFALAGGRGMVLASDKGFTHFDELFQRHQQSLAFHGSFSMMVNFHALGEYFHRRGGVYESTSQRVLSLKTAMYLLGGSPDDFIDTRSAFRSRIEALGPGEYFALQQRERPHEKTLAQILRLLKLSGYDPGLLYNCAAAIREQCGGAPEWVVSELRHAIDRAWSNFYMSSQNLPFELGRIYLALGRPMEAARFTQLSIDWFGEIHPAYLNLGLAYYNAENPQLALRAFHRAKELKPESPIASEWIARIEAEQERGIVTPTVAAT